MLHTIERAEEYYNNHKDVWHMLQHRGMTGDYSWTNSAARYVELYNAVLGNGPLPSHFEVPKDEPNPVVVATEKKA